MLRTTLTTGLSLLLLSTVGVTGCGDGGSADPTGTGGTGASSGPGGDGGTGGATGGSGGTGGMTPPGDVYELESKFAPGQSAISYSGQTFRHALIESMKSYVGTLTMAIDGAGNPPQTQAEMVSALMYYHDFDDASSGADPHGVSTSPDPTQSTWADISSDKNLTSKLAGNDDVTDHQDWDGGGFVGWADVAIAQHGGAIDSPEGLTMAFFNTLGWYVEDRINNGPQTEPGTTTPIGEVYVTAEGWDLSQLIQKFLLMSVAYSQGTDDYLDDDVADKGLLAANTQDGDAPYTTLGHQWDEGFGYFGAARDYLAYTDQQIADGDAIDTDMNGSIDLLAELNWGASTNAAKRDLGATEPTDYTLDAYTGFWMGRQLIHGAGDTLTDAEMTELSSYRDQAVEAWEAAIAATVVHYINATVADTEAIDGDPGNYGFLDHAKHWSEMKGFALGLQYNPRSKLSAADFVQIHVLIGDRPVLATATPVERQAYVTSLLAARDIFQTSYGLSAANVEGW